MQQRHEALLAYLEETLRLLETSVIKLTTNGIQKSMSNLVSETDSELQETQRQEMGRDRIFREPNKKLDFHCNLSQSS